MLLLFLLQANEAANIANDISKTAFNFINNPLVLGSGITLIIIAILILFFLKKIIVNSILGIICWAILTFLLHIELPFIPSLVVSIIFGLAGIGVMLLLKFFGVL